MTGPLATRALAPGPMSIALRFGALSVIPYALSLVALPSWWLRDNEPYRIDGGPLATVDLGPALLLSAVVILPTAVVVGWLAGRVWRRWRLAGVLVALVGAWAAGVSLTPLAAAALGIPLTTGLFCFLGCEAYLRSDMPWSGVRGYLVAAFGVALILYVLLVPLLVFAIARRAGAFDTQVLAIIAAHSVVFWVALLQVSTGALIPYACLAIGVIAWSRWLRRLEAEPDAAGSNTTLDD